MTEPDWTEVGRRLKKLTVKQLRPIKGDWFNGMLSGVSSKSDVVAEMITQMAYWWRNCDGGPERVMKVIRDVARIDGGWAPEGEESE